MRGNWLVLSTWLALFHISVDVMRHIWSIVRPSNCVVHSSCTGWLDIVESCSWVSILARNEIRATFCVALSSLASSERMLNSLSKYWQSEASVSSANLRQDASSFLAETNDYMTLDLYVALFIIVWVNLVCFVCQYCVIQFWVVRLRCGQARWRVFCHVLYSRPVLNLKFKLHWT